MKNDYIFISRVLNVLHSGILLGEIKGKDFIPGIHIGLSKSLNVSSVNKLEVDYNTAINYLKRVNIFCENEKCGYLLLTYKNQPLGWMKNLGRRTNNLYPNEWRIRMNI